MTSCQAQWQLFVWCLFLGMTGPACAQTTAPTASLAVAGWSDWSNGMRMRVTPTSPIFAPTEAPSLLVEFQVQRPVVASIPYLLPSDTNSTIGPFTLLEVWVWNTHSKEKYLATFEGFSLGRCFALGPEGSSVQRLSPGTNVTATLRLDGPFRPLKTLEIVREAGEKNLCISLDFLPKDLKRLPTGKYTLSLNVAPRSLPDLPAYKRDPTLNPPHVYRDVWTGTLGIHGSEFEVASGEAIVQDSGILPLVIQKNDKRLSPYCKKLRLLTPTATISDVQKIFGQSEGGALFVSSCYESVHSLDHGGKLRIRVKGGNGGLQGVCYSPPDDPHHTRQVDLGDGVGTDR